MRNLFQEQLRKVDVVLTPSSVADVYGAAALIRNAGRQCAPLFVDGSTDLNPRALGTFGKTMLFVNVPLQRRYHEGSMAEFLRHSIFDGHQLLGVCAAHSVEGWQRACSAADVNFEAMVVKPEAVPYGDAGSTWELLLKLLGDSADEHTTELLEAAAAAARGNVETHFGGLAHRVLALASEDRTSVLEKAEYLASHLSHHRDADAVIREWLEVPEPVMV